MTDINIFEFATREKLRFESSIGSLTVEQLWDLPPTSIGSKANLNTIGIQFVKALKSVNEESLVNPAPTDAQKVFQIQLDIVKHIIAVKQEEAAMKKEEDEKKVRKAKLQEALARKEDSALEELTPAELKKMIAEL
jgi:N-acetylmuramic acid 6-phosphate (MurNAc-6-P) etherase